MVCSFTFAILPSWPVQTSPPTTAIPKACVSGNCVTRTPGKLTLLETERPVAGIAVDVLVNVERVTVLDFVVTVNELVTALTSRVWGVRTCAIGAPSAGSRTLIAGLVSRRDVDAALVKVEVDRVGHAVVRVHGVVCVVEAVHAAAGELTDPELALFIEPNLCRAEQDRRVVEDPGGLRGCVGHVAHDPVVPEIGHPQRPVRPHGHV